MQIIYFFYGLIAFTMGLVVFLRGRHNSQLALSHQFSWLGAFGLLSSLYAWGNMLESMYPTQPFAEITPTLLALVFAASGIVLIRFGIGLIATAGPLPSVLRLLPVALFVPLIFVLAYALVAVFTSTNAPASITRWTPYLLLLPGCVSAAIGFISQWNRLKQSKTAHVSVVLLAAGLAFLVNALVISVVPGTASPGDVPVEMVLGVPVGWWYVGAMAVVAVLVSASMNVFETERQQEIIHLKLARKEAQKLATESRTRSRKESQIWLDALVKISRRIANMEDADAVLTDIVSIARETVHADTATLALYEPSNQLKLKYQATADGFHALESATVDNPFVLSAAQTGKSLRYPDDGNGADFKWSVDHQEFQAQVAAIVPLWLDQTPIGALWVGRLGHKSFSGIDLIGLNHLSNQAVIALEHASMTGQLQSLAVIEERSRIAREMHDSLAQILGYLGLEMQTLEALTRQHDERAALDALKRARVTIKSAQADVRENILSLKTTLAGDVGFLTSLTEYVEEFGIQTAIATQVLNQTTEELALSALAATQAVRIIQEALTNVRKHAKATCVSVGLSTLNAWLTISIADNGVGLPENVPAHGHFGLQTMRERAKSVGGTLLITSSPEHGTTVTLRLPLL